MTAYVPAEKNNQFRNDLASLRWLYILVASVLIHLLTLDWLVGTIRTPLMREADKTPAIEVSLYLAPKVVRSSAPQPDIITEAPQPKVTAPAPVSKPKKRSPSPAAKTPVVAVEPDHSNQGLPNPYGDNAAYQSGDDDYIADYIAETSDVTSSEITSSHLPSDPIAKSSVESSDASESVAYNIDLPPSVVLEYDVKKTPVEGAPTHGSGSISWLNNGASYQVDGEFGILFIKALHFQSHGSIEDTGVSPELYSEKRFRKAQTNTHFHRERNTISFSASTETYPRTGLEQDRASVIWQLAGIGRGDPATFSSGGTIDLFVAGTRNAEIWQMAILGKEDIVIDGQTIGAWHVSRAPRPGSYDQKLDIWLAPGLHWYPVRLRYTETNGDYLDMSVTGMNVPPPT